LRSLYRNFMEPEEPVRVATAFNSRSSNLPFSILAGV
jgi:hypothetical protein